MKFSGMKRHHDLINNEKYKRAMRARAERKSGIPRFVTRGLAMSVCLVTIMAFFIA